MILHHIHCCSEKNEVFKMQYRQMDRVNEGVGKERHTALVLISPQTDMKEDGRFISLS